MPKIQHILFPTDFSPRSVAAAPFVDAMAHRFNAKVTLLNIVVPVTYVGMTEPGAAFYIDPEELRLAAQKWLDGPLPANFGGIDVTRVAQVGDPGYGITEYAHDHKVDLIMMPTHGYGPFRSLLLGSVTSKVLHDARCPVWTAAHTEEPSATNHLLSKSILCAVDGGEASGPLMQWACRYASDVKATMRFVHAIPGAEALPERLMDREFQAALQQEARTRIADAQKAAGVNVPLCIRVGKIADVVREEAQRHNADLIVIGRGAIQEKLGRLKTHAYSIIRRAPCPVISV